MAKRKITVTVDEDVVALVQRESPDNLSAVVNEALAEYAERLARRVAMAEWLDDLDVKYGPVSDEAMAWARAAFDEADGLITPEEAAAVPAPPKPKRPRKKVA